jgi:hypothetical protein
MATRLRDISSEPAQVSYTKCLPKVKCCQCALPWYEVIAGSIPGVGAITSAIGWGCRERKVRVLGQELQSRADLSNPTLPEAHVDDGNYVGLSPKSERGATPLGESPPDSPPASRADDLAASREVDLKLPLQAADFSEMTAPFVEQRSASRLEEWRMLIAARSSNATFFIVNCLACAVIGGTIHALRTYNRL